MELWGKKEAAGKRRQRQAQHQAFDSITQNQFHASVSILAE
jgi:hypothetical protein